MLFHRNISCWASLGSLRGNQWLRDGEGEGFSKNGAGCLSRGLTSGPCTCNEVFKLDLKYKQIIAIIAWCQVGSGLPLFTNHSETEGGENVDYWEIFVLGLRWGCYQ